MALLSIETCDENALVWHQVVQGRTRPKFRDKFIITAEFLYPQCGHVHLHDPNYQSPSGRVTHVPKPISLERSGNNKDGLSMRAQQHDVELPMSPINRASSLELMDTTTTSTNATFLSNTGAGDGGGGGGRRGLEKLPRVSTQKIPHNTILDSFGPPRNMEVRYNKLKGS